MAKTRAVIIAPTKAEGIAYAANFHGIEVVAVLTPRSSHGARCRSADQVMATASMVDHPRLEELLEAARPSLLVRRPTEAELAGHLLAPILAQGRQHGPANDGPHDPQSNHEGEQAHDDNQEEGQARERFIHGHTVAPAPARPPGRCGACRDLSHVHTLTSGCQYNPAANPETHDSGAGAGRG